ncbi:MAG: PQQ-like beta-propeller repeat protein, partial [Acidobacteriota bacterium]|nr:PQQ-like beta-propeller repeat protein [Acidobacteriota bacterium]
MKRNGVAALLALALTLPAAAGADEKSKDKWTRWGGPGRDFKAPAEGIAQEWPAAGPKNLWTRELGDGYSAILVEAGRLYTMYRDGEEESVVALDAATGETLWETKYDHDPHENHVTQFGIGPRATPLLVGNQLYTIGVAGRMHCLDKTDGSIVWSRDLWSEEFGGNLLPHGYSSSPLEYGDTVIALVGGEGKSVVAFDKKDGSVVWHAQDFQNSYSSPQILEVDGQEQLVTFMAKELVSLDPSNGELLWSYPQENQFQQNINPPILVDGRYLFLSSPQAGAHGLKLTNKEDGTTEVEEVWSSRKIQFYHVTSVGDGDYVYGSSGMRSPAFMSAVNVKTGEIPWRKRGFGKANIVYADGRVVVLDEDGKLYLTTATPEDLTVHSEVELLDRVAWTVPTIVGNTMYVRDKVNVMALDLSRGQEVTETEAMLTEAKKMAAEATAEAAAVTAEATEAMEAMDTADEISEGLAILRKVDAAAKAVQAVRYKATVKPSGFASTFVSAAEGEGIMTGWNGQTPERFWARVKVSEEGSDEPVEISGGGNGELFFLINHQTKKAYQDMDPGVLGSSGRALTTMGMAEFVHPAPFDDEMNADKADLLGTEEVAGEECYKIDVVYSGGRGQSTWFFSTEDYLPRRRIRRFTDPERGEGAIEITMAEVMVDP